MQYKELVQQIANLDWQRAKPQDIIILSRCTAKEFAESLRKALDLYPQDERLLEMVKGELKTDNMIYEGYVTRGDHWEFLDYFITKLNITPSISNLPLAMNEYGKALDSFGPSERAMTVFSREEELTRIFRKISDAHDWNRLGLGFYKHYLESHILFDSGKEGHHHLTKHFPLHENMLKEFYTLRLKLYEALFEK
jgi:hypothetical protein